MFVVAISLGKVPNGALGLVVFASADDGRASVFVDKLIGPLPDIAHHIHHAVGAGSEGMRFHRVGSTHRTRRIRKGHGSRIPLISPWKGTTIRSLSGHLPFPLVGQTFARPLCIGSRIFK